jgi:AcrR family transcriptional regulator
VVDARSERPGQPRRSDAVSNHVRILEVAHEAFAESGATSLNEIAKRAGVGAGTLYRHFPTREALILAVYHDDIERLVASVGRLLAESQPLDAFRDWFEQLADYIRVKHGLGEALHTAAIQDAINETYAPVVASVRTLIRACETEGTLRSGLDPADVLLLMGFMWRVEHSRAGRAQARRIMEMAIGGLGGAAPPPTQPAAGTAARGNSTNRA